MAGGSGTRFWPRSRQRTPKQLLRIGGTRTMLQDTAARLSPLVRRDRVLAVVGRLHADAVRHQLPWLARGNLLVEPMGRNTLPAIALAAIEIRRHHGDAVMAVLPADHAIPDPSAFRGDLEFAYDVAASTGALVTFGIVPTRPETGYGYIAPGAPVTEGSDRAAWVARFVEKPDRTRAEAMLAAGGHLWNSGIFVWRVEAILDALRTHANEILGALERALERGRGALARTYARLPSLPIDTGVMERAERVAVVRARFPWSDVGSWAALEELWTPMGDNAASGRVVAVDSRGCVVDSPKRLVALLGVEDLVVVDADDAILVCRKDRAQDVRRIVDALGPAGLERYR